MSTVFLVMEVEVAIDLNDSWAMVVFQVIMAAIAKGKIFGLPAAAKGNGLTFAHFHSCADVAF